VSESGSDRKGAGEEGRKKEGSGKEVSRKYGVATISRLLKIIYEIIGLFCRISALL